MKKNKLNQNPKESTRDTFNALCFWRRQAGKPAVSFLTGSVGTIALVTAGPEEGPHLELKPLRARLSGIPGKARGAGGRTPRCSEPRIRANQAPSHRRRRPWLPEGWRGAVLQVELRSQPGPPLCWPYTRGGRERRR